jgi:hypothetical protein
VTEDGQIDIMLDLTLDRKYPKNPVRPTTLRFQPVEAFSWDQPLDSGPTAMREY